MKYKSNRSSNVFLKQMWLFLQEFLKIFLMCVRFHMRQSVLNQEEIFEAHEIKKSER